MTDGFLHALGISFLFVASILALCLTVVWFVAPIVRSWRREAFLNERLSDKARWR